MPATMDDFDVNIGDVVYDTAYGQGTVKAILTGNRFQVAFPDGRNYVYTGAGVNSRFTVRTLYWRNPVFAIPEKDEDRWLHVQNVCRAVVSAIRQTAS